MRAKERACDSGNGESERERERVQRRGRGATSPGFITAHCRRAEIALERRMIKLLTKWTVDEATD